MFPQNGKVHVGYKDLMENYQIIVSNLASERGEDTNLVLNLFQSLLDEFTRRCSKNDFDPVKVWPRLLHPRHAYCCGPAHTGKHPAIWPHPPVS